MYIVRKNLKRILCEATLNIFEHEEVVISNNLRIGLFTIGEKDNIDGNSRCTILKSHYRGTNLSLYQFFSTVNLGEKRYYEKYVKI